LNETDLVLLTLRDAVAHLPLELQARVAACAQELRAIVRRYNTNGCGDLALGLVGAEAAAEIVE
jgi:hypothetical protein